MLSCLEQKAQVGRHRREKMVKNSNDTKSASSPPQIVVVIDDSSDEEEPAEKGKDNELTPEENKPHETMIEEQQESKSHEQHEATLKDLKRKASQEIKEDRLKKGPKTRRNKNGSSNYPLAKLYKRMYRSIEDASLDLSYMTQLGLAEAGTTMHRTAVDTWENIDYIDTLISQLGTIDQNLVNFEAAMAIKTPGKTLQTCTNCNKEFKHDEVFPCCGGCSVVCQPCITDLTTAADSVWQICLGCMRQTTSKTGKISPTPICPSCPRTEARCSGDCNSHICKPSVAYYTACKRPTCRPCSILGNACGCEICTPTTPEE